MIFTLLLAMTMFLALIVQLLDVIPGLGGHVLLLPVAFLYAAAALPPWGMFTLAFLAGLMSDCLVAVPVQLDPAMAAKMDTFFGWNILVYGAIGAVMNGLHPLFMRGRWQIHCVLTGILTSFMVFVEFVFITFRREPFNLAWSPSVWRRIVGSGLSALIIAPVLFFVLNWIGRRLGHFDRARLAETTATTP
jgi:hypothetical protein